MARSEIKTFYYKQHPLKVYAEYVYCSIIWAGFTNLPVYKSGVQKLPDHATGRVVCWSRGMGKPYDNGIKS